MNHLQVRLGGTRLVILYRDRVYKIGRIRPIKVILKCFAIVVLIEHYFRLQTHWGGSNLAVALTRYFLAGIWSNRLEYQYWIESQDTRVAEVFSSHFGGLLLVQKRYGEVKDHTIYSLHGSAVKLYRAADSELEKASQFGRRLSNRAVIIDYGSRLTIQALRST
tara:strand:- start:52472 stop:52963 length:492 start_codon:yes stop_codon:yes gene_type:complete